MGTPRTSRAWGRTHETTHPRHPRHPGDIGDIGDISRKPLKMQGFLNVRTGDISGDIFLDGDIPGDIFWNEDFHAQDTLACAPHRSIRCYRGTPITKTPREVGVLNGWRPSR